MFERDPVTSTSFSDRPRQCVPIAVVMYNRVGSLTDAVDLRLVADDHPRCNNTEPAPVSTSRSGQNDVSVMVGQAGRRRVVVSNPEKTLIDAPATSEHQHTSHRTVLSSVSGTITKITISNDRERSDVAAPTVDRGRPSALQLSSPAATSSLSSPDDIKPAVLTQTAAAALDAPAGNARSQYSHLIRRRKKPQTPTASPHDRTQPAADLPSPPLPRVDDTPLTLLQHQKTLVSDITKQLSVELSAVTTFLRVTKPAHVDDRERVAMQSMQSINAAYQRLTSACLRYRQFCASVAETALPDGEVLRVHDSTLRRCRDKLKTSFSERRDVILQTPIAGEQRLFTFVWLQRHSSAIIDCINVVVEVLEAVLLPQTSGVQTSAGQPGTSNTVTTQLELTGGQEVEPITEDVKPNIAQLGGGCVLNATDRQDYDENARPPSLLPAIKTDIVASADEPPVLQPCNFPHPDGSSSPRPPPHVTTTAERRHSHDDHRCSATPRVNSSSPVVPAALPLALKQEQQEDVISTVQSCSKSVDTVPVGASETLDRSQLAGHLIALNGVITDTSGQMRVTVTRDHRRNVERNKATIYDCLRGVCSSVITLFRHSQSDCAKPLCFCACISVCCISKFWSRKRVPNGYEGCSCSCSCCSCCYQNFLSLRLCRFSNDHSETFYTIINDNILHQATVADF